MYEYINSCDAAFQLTGTKTSKKAQTDYCLNDETVNTYQPNESRTYYYSFNSFSSFNLISFSVCTQNRNFAPNYKFRTKNHHQ